MRCILTRTNKNRSFIDYQGTGFAYLKEINHNGRNFGRLISVSFTSFRLKCCMCVTIDITFELLKNSDNHFSLQEYLNNDDGATPRTNL